MLFVAGLLLGGTLGIVIMAIMCAGKRSDQLDELDADHDCDCAQERAEAWQNGYAKGADEAFELAHESAPARAVSVDVRFDDTDNEHTQIFKLANASN